MNGRDIKQIGVPITLDKERHFVLDMNALCELEEKYGSIDEAIKVLSGNFKIKDLRYILWLALKYEDEEIKEKEAGRLITLNDIGEVAEKLGKALFDSLPDDEEKNK